MNSIRSVSTLALSLVIALTISSCSNQKQTAYYQNIDQSKEESIVNFEPTIQPDDLLMIVVSAPDPEAAIPFNLEMTNVPAIGTQSGIAQRQQQLYLIDREGKTEFPVLGELNLGNKTKIEAIEYLKTKLKAYIKNPIVSVRIMNFKVSVQGEVNRPGTFNINSERITLPEALSLAGDMTIFGKRDNVIIIREINGKRMFSRVDLTKADFINSSYYYLSQNDMIYVEPNKAKSNSASFFNQNVPLWISIASLASSVIFSILLINKN